MRIKVNGVSLYFEVIGDKLRLVDGKLKEVPTMLVLHGGPGFDHNDLRPYFDRFADLCQLIYLDHRGNGRSDPGPRDGWNLAQWGDDIAAFSDALEIVDPVVVGHSFGGFVALSYMTRYPERPAKVVLSSTSATCSFDRSLAVYRRLGGEQAVEAAARFYDDATLENLIDFGSICVPLYHRTAGEGLPARPAIFNPDVLFDFWRNDVRPRDGALKSFDFRAGLLRTQVPVLVLGGIDDPACPIEDQEDIAAMIPGPLAELHRFDACGHGTFHDFPEETELILRRFLGDGAARELI